MADDSCRYVDSINSYGVNILTTDELAVKLDAFLLRHNMCPATRDSLLQSIHMCGHQLVCQHQYHGAHCKVVDM